MPMALKQDILQAKKDAGDYKPVDLTHLSLQTMGDQALEDEVLSVFASQSLIYLKLITSTRDEIGTKRAAHSLKGAARGIGAFRLAAIASHIEQGRVSFKSELESELKKVLDYIASLR